MCILPEKKFLCQVLILSSQFKLLFSIQILNSMNDEEMSCREVLIHVEVSGEESVTNVE